MRIIREFIVLRGISCTPIEGYILCIIRGLFNDVGRLFIVGHERP